MELITTSSSLSSPRKRPYEEMASLSPNQELRFSTNPTTPSSNPSPRKWSGGNPTQDPLEELSRSSPAPSTLSSLTSTSATPPLFRLDDNAASTAQVSKKRKVTPSEREAREREKAVKQAQREEKNARKAAEKAKKEEERAAKKARLDEERRQKNEIMEEKKREKELKDQRKEEKKRKEEEERQKKERVRDQKANQL